MKLIKHCIFHVFNGTTLRSVLACYLCYECSLDAARRPSDINNIVLLKHLALSCNTRLSSSHCVVLGHSFSTDTDDISGFPHTARS